MNIAVSSWALHRTLGVTYPDSPATGSRTAEFHGELPLALPELPGLLKAHGYDRMELCHFHVPAAEASVLEEFRKALAENGILLQSLLIDDGDVSDPDNAARDSKWIEKWIDLAAALGAERARVIAGKQIFSVAAFDRAADRLGALAEHAAGVGVRLTTENWYPLLSTPIAVNEMLDRLGGKLGLCGDFGNWPAPSKYAEFPLIFPRAETCHAKCDFLDSDHIDMEDYSRCLTIARDAGFSGPFTLVNGGPDDEWHALDLTREAILASSSVAV